MDVTSENRAGCAGCLRSRDKCAAGPAALRIGSVEIGQKGRLSRHPLRQGMRRTSLTIPLATVHATTQIFYPPTSGVLVCRFVSYARTCKTLRPHKFNAGRTDLIGIDRKWPVLFRHRPSDRSTQTVDWYSFVGLFGAWIDVGRGHLSQQTHRSRHAENESGQTRIGAFRGRRDADLDELAVLAAHE